MAKVWILCGHPNAKSLCGSLAEKYKDAASKGGAEVKLSYLSEMKFDPILHKGYSEIQELEEDLVKAQEDILWADHIVMVFPMWWSSVPALLKGFIDRVFLPSYAFKYHEKGPFWDRLLKGRTGHLIYTTDAPKWWNWLMLGDPVVKMMKRGVLEFCGVKPVALTELDNIRTRKPEEIEKALQKAYQLGEKFAKKHV